MKPTRSDPWRTLTLELLDAIDREFYFVPRTIQQAFADIWHRSFALDRDEPTAPGEHAGAPDAEALDTANTAADVGTITTPLGDFYLSREQFKAAMEATHKQTLADIERASKAREALTRWKREPEWYDYMRQPGLLTQRPPPKQPPFEICRFWVLDDESIEGPQHHVK